MPKVSERVNEKMRAEGFIGAREAAALTLFDASTIRKWAHDAPEGSAVRHGGLLFVRKAWLEERIAQFTGEES